jgi:nicotinamide-nucleotide amidase
VARGAVSEEVACAMAEGALAHSQARFAVAVTGIAGPGGGSADKPVGTVWIGVARAGQPAAAALLQCGGDRAAIRGASVVRALELLVSLCEAS